MYIILQLSLTYTVYQGYNSIYKAEYKVLQILVKEKWQIFLIEIVSMYTRTEVVDREREREREKERNTTKKDFSYKDIKWLTIFTNTWMDWLLLQIHELINYFSLLWKGLNLNFDNDNKTYERTSFPHYLYIFTIHLGYNSIDRDEYEVLQILVKDKWLIFLIDIVPMKSRTVVTERERERERERKRRTTLSMKDFCWLWRSL